MKPKTKFHKVMSEFKAGTLRSSSGELVTDRKQAIAIAMSESGMSKSKGGNMDKIKGGKADGMKCKDIAKKHGVPISVIMKEFELGKFVEREHTEDPEAIEEIARDHLFENPHYYSEGKQAGLFDELKKSIPAKAKSKVEKFLMDYTGDFNDEDLHALADDLKISPHVIEAYIYGIAREHLNMKKPERIKKSPCMKKSGDMEKRMEKAKYISRKKGVNGKWVYVYKRSGDLKKKSPAEQVKDKSKSDDESINPEDNGFWGYEWKDGKGNDYMLAGKDQSGQIRYYKKGSGLMGMAPREKVLNLIKKHKAGGTDRFA